MSKYFTKYLPVEGEIKEGDYVTINGEVHLCSSGEYLQAILAKSKEADIKKVKLFLCSRDIQVGDKIILEFGKEVILTEGHARHNTGKWFKVIGEISSKAVWVKDGDEFEKEQLFANGCGPNWNPNGESLLYKFKVQCPTCKQYH